MSKLWGLSLIPLIMIGFVALLAVLPRIDPYKKNYEKFGNWYEGFILLFILFMLAIQTQIILWSTGYQISPNLTMPFLIGSLFIYIGFLLGHAEQNWFVGIRTPWTSEQRDGLEEDPRDWREIIQNRWRHFFYRGIGRGICDVVHPRTGPCSCGIHGGIFLLRIPEGGKESERENLSYLFYQVPGHRIISGPASRIPYYLTLPV